MIGHGGRRKFDGLFKQVVKAVRRAYFGGSLHLCGIQRCADTLCLRRDLPGGHGVRPGRGCTGPVEGFDRADVMATEWEGGVRHSATRAGCRPLCAQRREPLCQHCVATDGTQSGSHGAIASGNIGKPVHLAVSTAASSSPTRPRSSASSGMRMSWTLPRSSAWPIRPQCHADAPRRRSTSRCQPLE